jgi:polar amino acid transport system permease protein
MSTTEITTWILSGLNVTLIVAIFATAIAGLSAVALGTLQHRLGGVPHTLLTIFIEFWRSSSVVILLLFFYYVLPMIGLRLDAIAVTALVLGLNVGAYGSQAVRGALESIGQGQVEAGVALGLSRNQLLLLVEIPQAIPKILPIFGNEAVEVIKGTANGSLLGLADITFRSKEVMQITYQPGRIYVILIIVYIVICAPIAFLTAYAARSTKSAER